MKMVNTAGHRQLKQSADTGRRLARGFRYLGRTALFALIVFFADLGGLLAFGMLAKTSLILILTLEGGLGLLLGVAVSLSATPFATRIGQVLLDTSPWSIDAEKHAMRAGFRWMLVSSILILLGFALSAS